jgi:hypothetical protein
MGTAEEMAVDLYSVADNCRKAIQDRACKSYRDPSLALTVVTGGTTVAIREKTKKCIYKEMPYEENLDVVSSGFVIAGKRRMVARWD